MQLNKKIYIKNKFSARNIKVVILCGGIGYRLKEETEFKPKPMIEIGGKPILWHIMKIYSQFGFSDFIIALGYKGNMIKDYFVNHRYYSSDFSINFSTNSIKHYGGDFDKFRITFVDTGLESLTGERLRRVKKYINEDHFMVTYGDGLADIDINKLIKFHKNMKTAGTVTGVYPMLKYGGLDANDRNLVSAFERKARIRHFINGGFMVFKKNVFKYIQKDSMIEDAFYPLIEEGQLALYKHDGFFHAMDTYQDVQDLNLMWRENPAWKLWY